MTETPKLDASVVMTLVMHGYVNADGTLTDKGRAAEDARAVLADTNAGGGAGVPPDRAALDPGGEDAIRAAVLGAAPADVDPDAVAVAKGEKPPGKKPGNVVSLSGARAARRKAPAPPKKAANSRGGTPQGDAGGADAVDAADDGDGGAKPTRKKRGARGSGPPAGGGGWDDPGEPMDCPVVPLGHDAGSYYFLSPKGEVRRLATRDLNPNGLISLFGGRVEWLVTFFPKRDRDGSPMNDFASRPAVIWLVRACEDVGLYDPATRIRGGGVWRVADAAGPVVHVGDAVLIGGEWRKPGVVMGRDVFPARPRITRPAVGRPATVTDTALIAETLALWRWRRPIDARLALGWIGAALLGGYPEFRAHLLVAAEFGSGKSTLMKFFQAVMGDQSSLWNDFTEAGVKQALSGEARAILLDEAEQGGATGARMAGVIELIRRMSTGEGASSVRGSPGGGATQSTVTGCTCMASVNAPPLKPADRSRIHRVDILKNTGAPGAREKVLAAIGRAAELSGAIRARVVLKWRLYAECLGRWHAALMADGCDGRQADMLSALLAGRDVMLHDAPPDSDTMADELVELGPVIRAMRLADQEDSDGQQCLAALLGFVPDHWRSGAKVTLGQMVMTALTEPDGGENDKAIRLSGLRIMRGAKGDAVGMAVAHAHPGLDRIFAHGGRWSGGGWSTSVERLGEDVQPWPKPLRFAGVQSRALIVPRRYLPESDDVPDDAPPPTPPPGGAPARS